MISLVLDAHCSTSVGPFYSSRWQSGAGFPWFSRKPAEYLQPFPGFEHYREFFGSARRVIAMIGRAWITARSTRAAAPN